MDHQRVNCEPGFRWRIAYRCHCFPSPIARIRPIKFPSRPTDADWGACDRPTLALLTAATSSPAIAQGPRPSSSSAAGFLSLSADPAAAKFVPRYEWQYHYAGRHAHWEGHLVLAPASAVGTARAGGKL